MKVFTAVTSRGRRGWPGGGHWTLPKRKTTKELIIPEKNMTSAMMKRRMPSLAGCIRPAGSGALAWTTPGLKARSLTSQSLEEIHRVMADVGDQKDHQDGEKDAGDDHDPVNQLPFRLQIHVLEEDQRCHHRG